MQGWMKAPTSVLASNLRGDASVRVAAAGDVHCSPENRDAVMAAFDAIEGEVDVVLLAGDLTTHGEPEQAEVLAEACRGIETPVVAVLGNHDLHANRAGELVEVLSDAGDRECLTRSHTTVGTAPCRVGVAGTKGFVGGFRGLGLPDFGEPSLRAIYAETTDEVHALSDGLHEIALCPVRGSRCCTTRPWPTRLTASRPRSGPSWGATAWPPRSWNTGQTSYSTDMPTRGASRPTSTASPSTTCPCP